jgi:hypothetical protein
MIGKQHFGVKLLGKKAGRRYNLKLKAVGCELPMWYMVGERGGEGREYSSFWFEGEKKRSQDRVGLVNVCRGVRPERAMMVYNRSGLLGVEKRLDMTGLT